MSLTTKHYDLTKKFRFESAHRLSQGYMGKCGNIHGHSWNGELTVRCYGLDSMGMGIDFGIMKELVLKEVEEMFDHKLILHKNDPIAEILKGSGTALVLTDENPTSEVLAEFIYKFASDKLNIQRPHTHRIRPSGMGEMVEGEFSIKVISVAIDETCTSSCKYSE